jgi:magnesium-transporting ATPase (P-type)
MVTGDHPHTATAIAREIGLVRSAAPVVITGEQLGHLSDIQLQLALDAPEIVFARVHAEQKMRIVGTLQKKREIVAVTGDGVNDGPALRYFEPLKGGFGAKNTASREFGKTIVFLNQCIAADAR